MVEDYKSPAPDTSAFAVLTPSGTGSAAALCRRQDSPADRRDLTSGPKNRGSLPPPDHGEAGFQSFAELIKYAVREGLTSLETSLLDSILWSPLLSPLASAKPPVGFPQNWRSDDSRSRRSGHNILPKQFNYLLRLGFLLCKYQPRCSKSAAGYGSPRPAAERFKTLDLLVKIFVPLGLLVSFWVALEMGFLQSYAALFSLQDLP